MHMAKGLEFRAVAVMACDDNVLPLAERIDCVVEETDLDDVYETERHLLYVACTRAHDRLMDVPVAIRVASSPIGFVVRALDRAALTEEATSSGVAFFVLGSIILYFSSLVLLACQIGCSSGANIAFLGMPNWHFWVRHLSFLVRSQVQFVEVWSPLPALLDGDELLLL